MKLVKGLALGGLLAAAAPLYAADYAIDTQGAHASVNFRINHLGFSYVTGRFEKFSGQFSYDAANPNAASVQVEIDPASVDTNHAERDKHLRSADFLDVENNPKVSFVSTAYTTDGNGGGVLAGDLSLNGVTKPVEIQVSQIGEGEDPGAATAPASTAPRS
ncbi:YceI family protein [Marinobacterium aestuariivivens]|uniref:YceI family protein n=1 Tax=Marinobacterium aestuariivivens TaxID=1698799 RepID=A0ABW2A8M4_9GAMM